MAAPSDEKALSRLRVALCDITLLRSPKISSSNKSLNLQNGTETVSTKREGYSFRDRKKSSMKRKLAVEEFEPNKLSDYELMIQKNREEKTAFLEFLKMNELKEELAFAVNNLKPKRPPVKRLTVKKPIKLAPVRKSLRLAKIDIDLSESALVEKVKAAALAEILQEELPVLLPFEKAYKNKNDDSEYSEFLAEFEDIKYSYTKKTINYESEFKNMTLHESHISKVTAGRITSMDIHPMTERIIVCAGSKYGNVGIWNVNSDCSSALFSPHLRGVTNLKFNLDNSKQLITSSYDGTVRCGDLEKKVFNEVFNISDETYCNYFDFLSASTFLVAQGNGNVSIVDSRSDSKSSQKKHKCHDYAVKTVSVHPANKSYFVTAESKGNLKLWDLRKLQRTPLVEVRHHKRSVNSALFSPVTGNSILTTSLDDTLCIFDSSNLGSILPLKVSMRHNNTTGRWLSTFKATWLPNSEDSFVVGSMLYPRRIEIYDSNMNNFFNFTSDNLGCITSVNAFHRNLPVLAGANSSGKVYVFAKDL